MKTAIMVLMNAQIIAKQDATLDVTLGIGRNYDFDRLHGMAEMGARSP